MASLKAALSCAAFLLVLGGCAATGGNALRDQADALGHGAGFSSRWIGVMPGPIYTLLRHGQAPGNPSEGGDRVVSIYIEGDGAPWSSPYRPPLDPTPVEPTVLRMAMADPGPMTAYLARPCQYLDAAALAQCDPAWRDEARFSPAVIAAYDAVLDTIKHETGASRLRLIGYSGGGVVAALLAARRTDVLAWGTVAAPLDLGYWLEHAGVSPLDASLDPMANPARLPGVHWVGDRDATVPADVVERYVRRHGGTVRRVSGYDHVCCWVRDWAARQKEMGQ